MADGPRAMAAQPGRRGREDAEEPVAAERGLFQDEDSCSDCSNHDKPGSNLQSFVPEGKTHFPEIFQTSQLLFYERFRAYQDYILADCKASEVREFTAEFLEKVLEPSGWQAVWHTNVFEVLVEVTDVDFAALKAVVRLADPYLCESQVSSFTLECMNELLDLKEHRLPLQELWVVFDDSGVFDQTALAIEHVRFFYQNIWRSWDEEEEDEYDYFVRCVEPRLRLHYDILEDRVPSGLIVDYHNLLSQCEESYRKFLNLRSSLSNCNSDSEQENISMVEGLKLYSEIEQLKQKLKLIENPLLRYVFGYQKNSNIQAKGIRPNGQKVMHVVSSTMMTGLLRSLLRDRLSQELCKEETEIQFHSDPLSAINACYEGDTVIVCPGHYMVHGTFAIADSIDLEGYGLPDDIVIEKRGKGDTFVDCTGVDIKISGIKFIQHDAVEGILIIHRGKTTLENCVLQCETTGVTVRTSAEFLMKNSDLYGAKDFLDEHYDIPKISMVNNVIHNNEGYGVVLVKPTIFSDLQENVQDETEENRALKVPTSEEADTAERIDLEELIQCATGKMELYARSSLSEQVEGNCEIVNELVAASTQKGQMKKKRLSELGITQADDKLMSQEMFVSIVGNQFKWNGKGSFGTFLF
ncbi:SHC SH2 domain-binding protein 1 isoform X2 [Canis lupus baileyi]|uniref:SHC SH2 domain-binding protein 1 isoform X2 n=1 Tax=Canis lupus familiaris TaxID=9615 RepID=UPI0003AE6436|nr:SHC SH2 domain-binding protein 1 isoform X2 [Canis lupus familiaris]XP_025275803.3 SHC SH2 domain-binding protein 1 isoform X2 [Canis lupus dingo]XP_038413917.1 SHC SH2 domain-binding protein 1 isoform X2 [Canis lupus familiaris]XP_038543550.1 SHC SH2 domain-binding protein 1 isoform X2 [Canis lupus familiaris]|eukprot:XP_005629043.1 SHC SH2 domain-binding protein 1 isoform X2 [Canis lupus familiaris]